MIEGHNRRLRKKENSRGVSGGTGPIVRRACRYVASQMGRGRRPKTKALACLTIILLSTAVVAQQADSSGNTEKPDNTTIFPKFAQNDTKILVPVSQDTSAIQNGQPTNAAKVIPSIQQTLAELFGLRKASLSINTLDESAPSTIDAGDVERGFAQAEDGQGPYRVAQVETAQSVGQVLGDQSSDDEELAQAEIREPETVTNDIDLALGQRTVYSDLRSLEDRIAEAENPITNFTSRYSTQSNDLGIYQEELSQDIFFSEGASRIRPGFQFLSYVPGQRTGTKDGVTEYSGGFDGSYRISDSSALTGDFWLNEIDPQGFGDQFTPTYDVYLTLWPNDFLRFDLDNKRVTFDNIQSLQLGITAESVGGSVDYTPYDFLRLTLRSSGMFYSDTNNRVDEEAEAVWKVIDLPIIEVGLRGSGFQYSQQLNNGYFDPGSYYSGEFMVRLQTDLTDNLNVQLVASGGLENANPGGDKPLVKSSLQVAYKLPDNWAIDGDVEYFSSQESNSAGFERTSFTLGLHKTFD